MVALQFGAILHLPQRSHRGCLPLFSIMTPPFHWESILLSSFDSTLAAAVSCFLLHTGPIVCGCLMARLHAEQRLWPSLSGFNVLFRFLGAPPALDADIPLSDPACSALSPTNLRAASDTPMSCVAATSPVEQQSTPSHISEHLHLYAWADLRFLSKWEEKFPDSGIRAAYLVDGPAFVGNPHPAFLECNLAITTLE